MDFGGLWGEDFLAGQHDGGFEQDSFWTVKVLLLKFQKEIFKKTQSVQTLRLVRLTEPLCLWLFYVWQQIPYFGSISDDEIQYQPFDATKTLRKLIGERRLLQLAFYFSVF